MARNDATTDPKDESIIAATTEPRDSGDALLDPSYSNDINTDRESSEPGELTSDRGDDDPSAGSANEGGEVIDMERLGGGVIDSPDDLGGDTSGSTLLDDLGASSETGDPADGFDGMTSDGGGISNIDLQNISPSDLPSGQGGGSEPAVGQGGSDRESQGGDDGESQGGGDDGESQGGTTPQGGQTMPAPDDGTGGGEIQGDVGLVLPNNDPDTESDIVDVSSDLITRDSASTLLDGDGDLAEMAGAVELSDVEIEIDASLADIDIGDDV